MANNNRGTPLFSVFVAVAAFVVSNIWSASLQKQIDSADHAMDSWTIAYQSVRQGRWNPADAGPDLATANRWLSDEIGVATSLYEPIQSLRNAGNFKGSLLGIIRRLDPKIKIESNSQQTLIPLEVDRAFNQLVGTGVSMYYQLAELKKVWQEREIYVQYFGYGLSILAIIVAAISQWSGATK